MRRSPSRILSACRAAITAALRPSSRWLKDDGTWVSGADLAVQDLLITYIRREFPDDDIVAEETTTASQVALGAAWCWILDPIDGTEPYLAGGPEYAVSVGLCRDGRIVDGALLYPALDVSLSPSTALEYSLTEVVTPSDVYVSSRFEQLVSDSRFLPEIQVRYVRSATFSCLQVIRRRASAYLLGEAAIWDICAVALVAACCGIYIYCDDRDPEPWDPREHPISRILSKGHRTRALLFSWAPRSELPPALWAELSSTT